MHQYEIKMCTFDRVWTIDVLIWAAAKIECKLKQRNRKGGNLELKGAV